MHRPSTRSGVRAIALVEATKGAFVLLAGFGLLSLVHHNVEHMAAHLVGWVHLDHFPSLSHVFLKAASEVTDSKLQMLAAIAGLYSTLRLVEAYGLWNERRWAEWFALLSGAVYLPIELYELARGFTWIKLAALAINLSIVAYMGYALWRPGAHPRETAAPAAD